MRLFTALAFFTCVYSNLSQAEDNIQVLTEENYFISARAAALSEATSPIADGIDAPFYNPAAIGGIYPRNSKSTVRELYFPYLATGLNDNSTKIYGQTRKEGPVSQTEEAGDAILRANEGKRQYGRASALFDLVIGRMQALTFTDYQIVAIRKEDPLPNEKPISATYLARSGAGLGFSMLNNKETFYLGVSAFDLNSSQFTQSFDYSQIANATDRANLISSNKIQTHEVIGNAGSILVMGKRARPSLSLVARGVKLKNDSSSSAAATDFNTTSSQSKIRDLTLGFSISPQTSSNTYFNLITEAHHLTADSIAVRKKIRIGMEFNIYGIGRDAPLSFRLGANDAGASYGTGINLGLVQFEVASYAQDIGINNHRVIERRNLLVFSVNAAE